MKKARPVSKGQAFLRQVQYVLLLQKKEPEEEVSLASAFVARIASDKEWLVLLKPVVLFFIYLWRVKRHFV